MPTPTAPAPHATVTSEPTLYPTATQPMAIITATPTDAPAASIQWNEALKRFNLNADDGVWARTSDRFLYLQTEADETSTLYKISAPDFKPIRLYHPATYFTLSPDDQFIVYKSGLPDSPEEKDCVMDLDGNFLRAIDDPIHGVQYHAQNAWLGPQNIVSSRYSGGQVSVHSVNIETARSASWGASIHGNWFPPKNGYIPATSDTGSADPRLMVIAQRFPSKHLEELDYLGGNVLRLPAYRSTPQMNTISTFQDWFPNGNQILLFWGQFNRDNGWVPVRYDLLLWDVDKNTVRLMAPFGRAGQFSPDGKFLAYTSYGPATLDSSSKPVDSKQMPEASNGSYMQLMELSSGKVFLSLPILARVDNEDLVFFNAYGTFQAQFSPDSRYLAFFSPGSIVVNSEGWPVGIKDSHADAVTFNVLDLQEKSLLWSQPSIGDAEYAWSPTSNGIVFQDKGLNWHFINLREHKDTFITLGNADNVYHPGWSYDGHYLSLESCTPSAGHGCDHDLIHVIDLTGSNTP